MYKKNLIVSCTLCLALIITACSYLTPPIEKPIIPDNARGLTTFAIIPSRRLVVVKPYLPDGADQEKDVKDIYLEKFICSEPVPDVSDNIASSISAAFTAKGEYNTKASAEIAANLARVLGTTSVTLFKRTQGLQLYRDGMFNLCLASMNGKIEKEEYKAAADLLLEKAVKLIETEIPLIQRIVAEVSAQNAAASSAEAKQAAVDADASAKSAKQSADTAEAAVKKKTGGTATNSGGSTPGDGGTTGGGSKPQ